MKKNDKTELTKERILAAALDAFGTKGYASASLNDICDAGLSKGLIYHNFKSKDEIYLCCLQKCFFNLTNYIQQQNIYSNPQSYMDVRLCFFKENKKEARLFFEAVLQPPEHLKEDIKELQADFDELNKKLYRQLLQTVTLRQGVTEQDAMAYFTLMQNMFNGYFSSVASRSMAFSDIIEFHEESLSKFLDFMFYGIANMEAQK